MRHEKQSEDAARSDRDREAAELWQQILRNERRDRRSWREVFEAAEAAAGAKVRALRIERGWSQGDLADKLEEVGWPLHQTNISKLEAGRRPIRVAELHALAAVFGLPPIALWYLPVPGEPWSLARMREELEHMDERVASSEESLQTAVRMYADHQFERERLVRAMDEAAGKASRGELEEPAVTRNEPAPLAGELAEARAAGGFPAEAIRAAVALQEKAYKAPVTSEELGRITSGMGSDTANQVIASVAEVAVQNRDGTVLRHIRAAGLEKLATEGLARALSQRAGPAGYSEEIEDFLRSNGTFYHRSVREKVDQYTAGGGSDWRELAALVAAQMTPEELVMYLPLREDRTEGSRYRAAGPGRGDDA